MRHIGQLTSAALGESGHVREAAPARGETGRLTYLQQLVSIRHYGTGVRAATTRLADCSGAVVYAASTAHWEVEGT